MVKEGSFQKDITTRERVEQVSSPFDDPLFSEKDRELIQTSFGRSVLSQRRGLVVRYGYCEPTHPLQVYLDSVVATLPQLKDTRCFVLPGEKDPNACAFPDGTIFVSPALIKLAESEDGLGGVLLHEWIHQKRKHVSPDVPSEQQKSDSSLEDSLLRRLSTDRAKEYIADIQGAVIELDKIGKNPLGFKKLLENLGKKEASRGGGGGVVHGSSYDRALNVAEIVSIMHLPSTEKPLVPIDAQVPEWIQEKKGTHFFVEKLRNAFPRKLARQELEVEVGDRVREIAQLPVCFLPEAMVLFLKQIEGSAVNAQVIEGSRTTRFMHDGYFQVLQALMRRLAKETTTSTDDAWRTTAAQLASSFIFIGHDFRFPEKGRGSKDFWNRIRGELMFVEAMGAARDCAVEIARRLPLQEWKEKGLFPASRLDFLGFTDERILAQFPQKITTPEEAKKWWAYTLPFVRAQQLCVMAGKEGRDPSENVPLADDIQLIGRVMREWAMEVIYPGVLEKQGYEHLERLLEVPAIQSMFALLWSHPDAPTIKKSNPLVHRKDRYEEAVEENTQELHSGQRIESYSEQIFDMLPETERLSLSKLEQLADTIVTRFAKADVGELIEAIRAITLHGTYAVTSVLGLLVLKRLFLVRQEFKQYSSHQKRLFLYFFAEDGSMRTTVDFLNESRKKRKTESSLEDDGEDMSSLHVQSAAFLEMIEQFEEVIRQVLDDTELFSQVTPQTIHEEGQLMARYMPHCKRQFDAIAQGSILSRATTATELLERYREIRKVKPALSLQGLHASSGPLLDCIAKGVRNGDLDRLSVADRIELMACVLSPNLKARFFDHVLSRADVRSLSYHDQLGIIDAEKGNVRSLGPDAFNFYFEECPIDAATAGEVKDLLEREVHHVETKGSQMGAIGVLLDWVALDQTKEEGIRFIQACLASKKSDEQLKGFVLRFVAKHVGYFDLITEHETLDTLEGTSVDFEALIASFGDEELLLKKKAQQNGKSAAYKLQMVYDQLFRLTNAEKHFVLRQVLGGRNGVLRDPQARLELLHKIRAEWVQEGADTQLDQVLQRLEEAVAKDEEWEILYLGISGLLRDHALLRTPDTIEVPWEAQPEADEFRARKMELTGAFQNVWEIPTKEHRMHVHRYPSEWLRYGERALFEALLPSDLKGSGKEGVQTATTYAANIAMHGTALAVRSMQNIDQIAHVTPEEAAVWKDIYDAVQGQSRMAALTHLERVWPGFWEEYPEVRERVGGGSIFTVFKVVHHTGRVDVIKMLNPNINVQLGKANGLFRRTAARLASAYGGTYGLVPGLLDDVSTWLNKEMTFAGYLPKDQRFYGLWNGFKEGRYRLRVPKTYGPEHKEFVQEEFVKGTNLTGWDELVDKGHDLKEVTKLLSGSYVGQLLDGQALSDIHLGNEAVTDEDEIALFDRVLYLELEERDKRLLQSMFTATTRKQRSTSLEEYFVDVQGGALPKAVTKSIQSAGRVGLMEGARELLLALREAGIQPPLQFMLAVKNLRVLDGMSKRAGWRHGMIQAVNG